jgi:hypothetical protein
MNSSTKIRADHYSDQTISSEKTTRYVEPIEDSQVIEADSDFMLCCYHNPSSRMQIIRSDSHEIPEWHLERVVFPGQRLLFHAPQRTSLQIYSAGMAENLLNDTVPCDRIRVDES